MITWKNMDTLAAYQELQNAERVNLVSAMSGEAGAERVKSYSVPMGEGLDFNYGARPVDDKILEILAKLAAEAQLTEKYEALYNGEVINTGEKRRVLHHLTRGQLGETVMADGVDKRAFYVEQQEKIADLAKKVRSPTQPVRSSPPWCRSVSAAATWAPAPSIWLWRTGPRSTTP